MTSRLSLSAIFGSLRYVILPVLVIAAVVVTGLFFFWHGRSIMKEELKNHLRSTAVLAATQIDPSALLPLQDFADTSHPQYRAIVSQLDHMRRALPDVRFVYIMRPTEDPLTFAFVADADGLATTETLDLNKNGVVDPDEEIGHPGDLYDISEIPALQGIAGPVVDDAFTVDQWGTFMSAYAPIYDAENKMIAVLGMDMNAADFNTLTQRIFSPVALLLVVFAGLMMVVYVVIVVRHRRIESMQQLNTERTALMDLATHQLGAPLATFKWWVEILRDDHKLNHNPKAKKDDDDALSQLEEGIVRMDDIIASLRTAVHLQSTQVGYEAADVTVRSIITAIPKSTALLLRRRKQTLTLKVPSSLRVTVDKKLFTGALQELIENASWYSPEKAVITVRAKKIRRHIQIDVEDHGCGISSNDFPHLFEQFKRGSTATNYKPVGNGLGLYIAKGIVEGAKGNLSVQSVVGKGTTFTITLPLV